MDIILTQYSGAILGPIAKLLGWIMNGIYIVLDKLGIQDIGLTIIILTMIIYLCMLPLTIKQQKFSKLSQKMQPELQAIQKKYQNKKDQVSMQRMQQETQEVYQKYGISPTGSCLQLFITFPILLALYRVIINVPAYVGGIKNIFTGMVDGIYQTEGFAKILTKYVETAKISGLSVDFSAKDSGVVKNYIVDMIYKMPSSGWDHLQDKFSNISDVIESAHEQFEPMVTFLGLNITDSPMSIIKTSFSSHAWVMLILAILVPLISLVTQFINIKLMPQPVANGENDAMAAQMKTMNIFMPLFSFVMCFTVPVGLGIYWIAGAVFRGIQQFFINKHMEKIDLDDLIAKNQAKMKKRYEKLGITEEEMKKAASIKTKNNANHSVSSKEKEEQLKLAEEKKRNVRPDSMAAKANLVREFNEGNRK